MSLLAGRVALITGASRGIGLAIAKAFAREGAQVAICGRHRETIEAAAEEIGSGALSVTCHVGRAADLELLVSTVTGRLGPIDILVNNAGTNIQQGPCLQAGDAQFDKMVEINLKSCFRLINLVAPEMCRRGAGNIINIASVAGIKPQFESVLYSMTKAALIMLTQSYALELGPSGVRVNAIAPGLVRTALSEYFWKDPERSQRFTSRQPVPYLGEPADIAEVALLLASGRSSYMTGQTVVVDGGLLLS